MSHLKCMFFQSWQQIREIQRDFYSLFSNDRDCMRPALDDVRAVFAFSGFYFCFVDKTVRMSVRETIVRGNHK